MSTAFVTGATGFLGQNLTQLLSERGWKVFALSRDPASDAAKRLESLTNVDVVRGDLTIGHSIRTALPEKLDVIFHCAADTSTWSGHSSRQTSTNVEGTRTVIHLTYETQAQVLVHVSTASVYGEQKDRPYTETAKKMGGKSISNYVRTKLAAEQAILRAVERGLEAVIVNPGHIMGPYDTHNWASLIKMIAEETLPGIPPGSGCFTHVEDVCEALIRAAEVGKSGENYLLGGPNATFEDVIAMIAQELGVTPPGKVVPGWLLSTLGRWNALKAGLKNRPPAGMTPEAAWFVSHDDHFTSDKAQSVLGYTSRPLKTIIQDAVAWQAQIGAVKTTGTPPVALEEEARPTARAVGAKATGHKQPAKNKTQVKANAKSKSSTKNDFARQPSKV